jgi:DnaJ family protein C protein 2
MSIAITKVAECLDWPEELLSVILECAGQGYIEYQQAIASAATFLSGEEEESDTDSKEETKAVVEDHSPEIDLFDLTPTQLEQLNYYQVLHMPYLNTLSPDDVKKAYRKACLKYHPDKSGRGEEDEVFLKVKTAFETLTTQKQAYDSTEMPFDEKLPSETPKDFYKEYGVVFQLNSFFDSRQLQDHLPKPKANKRKNKHKIHHASPPKFGDENSSIDEVHHFYDYWTHFTTWRDFSLKAAQELETEDQLEQAESRYEKRWYQKEIDRLAKKLKQKEQARITMLVERAMATDPRLLAERKRLIEEKERKQRERQEAEIEVKRQAVEAKLAEARKAEEEKQRKSDEKNVREKEKKLLRKTKQVLRKYVSEALASTEQLAYILEDDVDTICGAMDREMIIKFNTRLDGKSGSEVVELVKKRASNIRDKIEDDDAHDEPEVVVIATATKKKEIHPFSKDELSGLAKGVKKFPPGGANRWDQIANYLNNSVRPDNPRSKEDCIAMFNKIAKGPAAAGAQTNGSSTPAAVVSEAENTEEDDDVWTDEQDHQLQEGLVTFPASIEKNERWTSISNVVTEKSKKQCVNRFKVIRDAIKNKK